MAAAAILGLGEPAAAAGGAAAGGAAAQEATRGGAVATTVTLITGDRVSVLADGGAVVARNDQRPGISYLVQRQGGHTTVMPSDAAALVRSGQLDRRLFDVTTLVEARYDDRHRDLGIIVEGTQRSAEAAASQARSRTAAAGASVTREYKKLGAVAAHRSADRAEGFWDGLTRGARTARSLRSEVQRVWLDGVRTPLLDVSVPQIGAPVAWQGGQTGEGVTVAVLDTGIDDRHPDLAGKVVARKNFTEGYEDDRDLVGHGTHVASTLAGTGAASEGKYQGVAPGAQLLDGKVCVREGCDESWILAGMQWAAAEQHARIVSLSLGGTDTPEIDPLEEAVGTLTKGFGTLFVIAAGNLGGDATVSSPASADDALAVGAVDDNDALAGFSSRGPRVADGAIKPDVTAPGVDITAARGTDALDVPGASGDLYTTISGTSMATPHVAGAAAILAQRHPDATPAELKAQLMGTADPNPALDPYEQGAGRINVGRAVDTTLIADPSSVSFGTQLWPHDDDEAVTKTISYRNSGSSAVTLSLDVTATASDGAAAPAGLFSVSPTTVEIPAGGTAAVSVTADTRVAAPDGYAYGRVTATGGPTAITTPFAVDKEVESYDVTLTHLDRFGAPATMYYTVLGAYDSEKIIEASGDSTMRLRVPKGRYALASLLFDGEDEPGAALLANPEIVVTAPVSVTVDGQVAKPISVTVPGADPESAIVDVSAGIADPTGFSLGLITGTLSDTYTAQLGGDRAVEHFFSALNGMWKQQSGDPEKTAPEQETPEAQQAPAGPEAIATLPAVYNLAWMTLGRMETGISRTVSPQDLATVTTTNLEATPRTGLLKFVMPQKDDLPFVIGFGDVMSLPSNRTEYYNTDGGIRWQPVVLESVMSGDEPTDVLGEVDGPVTAYQPGRTVHEVWNRATFGPSLAQPSPDLLGASRSGNAMLMALGAFGDGEGRWGLAATSSASTTLSRDGIVLGTSDQPGIGEFQVPAKAGRYRLAVRADRVAPAELSTSVQADWTFRSGNTGETTTALPLWSVRFAPAVDCHNAVRAGQRSRVPVVVAPQSGAQVGKLKKVTVDASYDDGATWQRVPVRRSGGSAFVTLDHPVGASSVSLRAQVADSAGNTLDQTLIHAYRIIG